MEPNLPAPNADAMQIDIHQRLDARRQELEVAHEWALTCRRSTGG